MIKMMYTGKKKPEQSMEEFRAYYLDHHAPLFLRTVPQARKYTINFPSILPGKEAPALDYDFITEIWWEDVDSVRAFYKSDEYKDIILPDEQRLFAAGSGNYFDEFVQKA